MAPNDIVLKFTFPTTPDSDMRTFRIYRLVEGSTDGMIELYRFHHPATGLPTGSTTFRRQNMSTNIFETAGQIDWTSNHNATVQFGLEEVHIRELRRVKKSGSQSRRFKAGGSEYKWKIADNELDLLCVDSRGKAMAIWNQEERTLGVSSKVEPILDRVVVTCFLNIWVRNLGEW